MLQHLQQVLVRDLDFAEPEAERLCRLVASYAREGPSLTLGGVGVMPLRDVEDRHVLETAWAAGSDVLVTANLTGFVQDDDEHLITGRVFRLRRGGRSMVLSHPYEAIDWLRSGVWRARRS